MPEKRLARQQPKRYNYLPAADHAGCTFCMYTLHILSATTGYTVEPALTPLVPL